MCETVAFFNHQLTNSQKYWKSNQKNTQTGVFDFWQDILCDYRADEIKEILFFGREIKLFLNKYEYLLIQR